MKKVSLALSISFASIVFPAGDLAAVTRAECPEIWNLDEFEGAGGVLTTIVQPNLENLPKNKGAGTLHVIVLRNGYPSLGGWDATFGLEATNAVEKRIALMRFAPPHLRKKSVCVFSSFKWSSESPLVLEKDFSARWTGWTR
jgi:hypothetical protein